MWKDTTHLFTNTEPIDREAAAQAMKDFYEFCGQEEPEIVFVDGPKDLEEKLDPELEGFSFFDHKELAQFVSKRGIGRRDRIKSDIEGLFWKHRRPKKMKSGYLGSSALLVANDYEYDQEFQDKYKWFKFATAVWNNSLVTVNFKGRSYIVDRPAVVKTNDRGLHCEDGPALVFRDGSEFYFWNSERFTKKQFENPQRIPLEEIHAHSNKHIMIAFVGVEHYLKLVSEWEPNVKGKFKKFFDFAQMKLPEDELVKESWNKKGRGWMYEDGEEEHERNKKPYLVTFGKASVNGKDGNIAECHSYRSIYFLPNDYSWKGKGKHWCDCKAGKMLFEEGDRELLDLLDIQETMSKSHFHVEISYHNGVFKVATPRPEKYIHGVSHMDVAPAWFRAKMFLGEPAYYETDKYVVKWDKDNGLQFAGDLGHPNPRTSLFSGNEQLPWCHFDFELTSDTWEGLLEKWARFAFEWHHMQ